MQVPHALRTGCSEVARNDSLHAHVDCYSEDRFLLEGGLSGSSAQENVNALEMRSKLCWRVHGEVADANFHIACTQGDHFWFGQ